LKNKVIGTAFEKRIMLHQCKKDSIGISESVDFALAFYMVHEVLDQVTLFNELTSLLKPEGWLLVVEPKLHVSKKAFEKSLHHADAAGLRIVETPNVFFGRSALFQKAISDLMVDKKSAPLSLLELLI